MFGAWDPPHPGVRHPAKLKTVESRFQFNNLQYNEYIDHCNLLSNVKPIVSVRTRCKHFSLHACYEQSSLGRNMPTRSQMFRLSPTTGQWDSSEICNVARLTYPTTYDDVTFYFDLDENVNRENGDCCTLIIIEFGRAYGDDVHYLEMGGDAGGGDRKVPLCSLYDYTQRKDLHGFARGTHSGFPISCSWIGNFSVITFGRLVGVGFGTFISGFDDFVHCFQMATASGLHRMHAVANYGVKWSMFWRQAGSDVNGYSAVYHCFMQYDSKSFVLRDGLGVPVLCFVAQALGAVMPKECPDGKFRLDDDASPLIDNEDLFPLVTCFEQLMELEAGNVTRVIALDKESQTSPVSRAMFERLRFM